MEIPTPFLVDAFIKSAAVLLLAALVVVFLRRGSAAARHLVWAGAVAGVLLLPLLVWVLPAWSVIPSAAVETPAVNDPVVAASEPEPFQREDRGGDSAVTAAWRGAAAADASDPTEPVDLRDVADAVAGSPVRSSEGWAEREEFSLAVTQAAKSPVQSWWSALLRRAPWIWLAGAGLALLPMIAGRVGLFRLKRTARRVTDPAWLSLLAELKSDLKISRPVVLLESPVCTMPMTWGALPGIAPKVLLPEDALHEWSAERRRAVLLHELAHVKRRDCLTHLLSQLACALYWCNPLIWVASRRMLVERERACDDLALRQAMAPAAYAKHLLEIATAPQANTLAAHAGVAMARPSQLGDRLVAVLDEHRNRQALSRLTVAAMIALIGAVVVPVAMLQATGSLDRPDLSGIVTDQYGQPLRDATVFIHTAAPREGLGILCPSCYADCAKSANTDSVGRFTIESLDPELIFQILVVAEGYRPEFVGEVDPFNEPLEVALDPASAGDTPNHRVRGRVVDAGGNPVPGAVAWLFGVTQENRTWWGRYEGFDPVAVADTNGEFVIHSEEPFEEAGFKIEARGKAGRTFGQVSSGDTVHEFPLTEGVSVTGRVMKDGEPLAGVEVGMTGADREISAFVGDHSIATDDDGYFLIVNLPAETEYYFYGSMETLENREVIPSRPVHVGEDGTTLELGDVNVETGFHLEGRIRLTDGGTVPPGTPVLLSREQAWDSVRSEADAEGRFRFHGIPSEPITLSARIEGYRPSLANSSLDELNPVRLIGTLYSDKTDLVLEVEPGVRSGRLDDYFRDMKHEPLSGAEASSEPGDIRVNGRVVDAETGDLLPAFTVTPGRASTWRSGEIEWSFRAKSTHTAGSFSVSFQETEQAPALLIEAEGYFSHVSDTLSEPENDLLVEMEKGASLSGVVLRPDGQPAAQAAVYLADPASGTTVRVSGNDEVTVGNEPTPGEYRAVTDGLGRFSFYSRMAPAYVLVLDDAGFAEVPVEGVTEGLEVTLQPWARVEGQLRIGANPAENETVRLEVNHIPLTYWGALPPLSYSLRARTDSDGEFVFEQVPPFPVEIYYYRNRWQVPHTQVRKSQTKRIEPAPGETYRLTLGGSGRPVVGRMVAADYDGDVDWMGTNTSQLLLFTPWPPELQNEFPEFIRERDEALRVAESDEEKEAIEVEYLRRRDEERARLRAAHRSEAGREHFFSRRQYQLEFSPDGSFRIDDVPGGEYRLSVVIIDQDLPLVVGEPVPYIVNYSETIEIPESPNGRTDEPYDLGVIEVEAPQ